MKCLSFTRAVSLPVLGLIENMSGYVCPCCGEVSNIFSTGGGASLAAKEQLNFLGSLPVDTELVTLLDAAEGIEQSTGPPSNSTEPGFELLQKYQKTSSWPLFREIVEKALVHLPTTETSVTVI